MIPQPGSEIWDEQVEQQNKEAITRAFYRLTIWVLGNSGRRTLNGDLIRWFHGQAFARFFPLAAGQVRGPDFPVNVDFGNYKGLAFDESSTAFGQLCTETELWIIELDSRPEEQRGESVVQVACHHHARFIRIHPFVDGNGRIGRLCVNYFAARYGLSLVPIERPDADRYLEALKVFIQYGKVSPLVDLWRPALLRQPV
jgi:Fic family protein